MTGQDIVYIMAGSLLACPAASLLILFLISRKRKVRGGG